MKKIIKYRSVWLLVLFFTFSINLFPQPGYLKQYDRIPMKVQLFGSQLLNHDSVVHRPNLFNKIKNMGADIVVCENVVDSNAYSDYDSVYSAGLKLMPFQQSGIDYIAKYAEASYTMWEAEGTPEEDGDATLTRDSLNTGITTSGTRTCIVTEPESPSGLILWGPGYAQRKTYYYGGNTIEYTAQYQMKLDYNPYYEEGYPELEGNEIVVCTLQVTASKFEIVGGQWQITQVHVVDSMILKAMDFERYGSWKNFEIDYSLENLIDDGLQADFSKSLLKEAIAPESNVIRFIEFRVIWNQINFAQLYVDKIILSDVKGEGLLTGDVQEAIINMSDNTTLNWSPDFDNTVVSWYLKDEPNFIDNQEPVRIINNLIKGAAGSTGRQAYLTIAGSFNGTYSGSNLGAEPLNVIEESLKRNKMEGVQLNFYLYDYPWNDDHSTYKEDNVYHMTETHLSKINNSPYADIVVRSAIR